MFGQRLGQGGVLGEGVTRYDAVVSNSLWSIRLAAFFNGIGVALAVWLSGAPLWAVVGFGATLWLCLTSTGKSTLYAGRLHDDLQDRVEELRARLDGLPDL